MKDDLARPACMYQRRYSHVQTTHRQTDTPTDRQISGVDKGNHGDETDESPLAIPKRHLDDVDIKLEMKKTHKTRMWANAQPDGRPAEHLFNAPKFG